MVRIARHLSELGIDRGAAGRCKIEARLFSGPAYLRSSLKASSMIRQGRIPQDILRVSSRLYGEFGLWIPARFWCISRSPAVVKVFLAA